MKGKEEKKKGERVCAINSLELISHPLGLDIMEGASL
jgi:hypothetical protein